ncbi:uncharacterized protein EDB91DRAFT_1081463 [Suillus paluster]|uniref:uncharacterized protein n=1 Tax=Suillus paluster TaxID=48578 RepID=UPI001B876B09|nr:uncharacterized protein EDB91DRAFT_1081463 [Suillus paluster]KAG1742285.1 hypothetical protein EDB91DRAFT_1081463 [Suillus paluster]
MQIDIARYSKLISLKDTGHNEEREKKLLDRSPPGHEGTKSVDIPATVLDVTGAIIVWYLPGALTGHHPGISDPSSPDGSRPLDILQEEIWKASQLLTPTHEKSVKVGGSWRTNEEWFGQGSRNGDITAGCINISLAWFQQGHETVSDLEVSASLKGPLSEDILKAIARPVAIASAALRACESFQALWFDILTTVGNYSNACMSMPSLQLEFMYDPGVMITFSGRIVRHGVHEVAGDQVAWA